MMGQKIATTLEIVLVTIGVMALGILGAYVTPKESQGPAMADLSESRTDAVIADARSGYDLDTCVRDISSRTILSDQASGAPELVVLEGAPVTECFPELAQFFDAEHVGKNEVDRSTSSRSEPPASFGADMRTSVVVIPSSDTSREESPEERFDGEAMSTGTPVSIPKADEPSPSPAIPSGGSTGGSAPDLGALPPVDRFDACRVSIFGESVPENLSTEEYATFEECLNAEFPPDIKQ